MARSRLIHVETFHLEAERSPEGGGYELDVPIIGAVYYLVCYLS